MSKPVWVNNLEQGESLLIVWVESTDEYVVVMTDSDGEIISGDTPLAEGFQTEKSAQDYLDGLGLQGWY